MPAAFARRAAAAAATAVGLAACAGDAPRPSLDPTVLPEAQASVDVPYYPPVTPSGAVTATAMVLDYYERPLPDARLMLIETDPTRQLPGAVTEAVWETGLSAWLLTTPESLLLQVADGHPLVLRLREPDGEVHYAVLVGYDLPARTVYLHGPQGRAAPAPLGNFLAAWYSGGWSLAVLPPGREPLIAPDD